MLALFQHLIHGRNQYALEVRACLSMHAAFPESFVRILAWTLQSLNRHVQGRITRVGSSCVGDEVLVEVTPGIDSRYPHAWSHALASPQLRRGFLLPLAATPPHHILVHSPQISESPAPPPPLCRFSCRTLHALASTFLSFWRRRSHRSSLIACELSAATCCAVCTSTATPTCKLCPSSRLGSGPVSCRILTCSVGVTWWPRLGL